jgi:poly-gamma-glutamate synthesis protein (capsule biosynthesis protein)
VGEPIIKDGPVLRGPPEAIAGFKAGGFDAACLANNHVRDMGPRALLQTIGVVRAAGIEVFGAAENEEAAAQPLFIERRGQRVGLLAFAENEFSGGGPDSAGANPYRPGPNAMAVARARSQCDLVLVFVHGGSEYCPFPSPRMVRDYRAFAEAGADAVIGHHPHTVQGMELCGGVPILYSLGNFLFWVRKHEENNPMWPLEMMVRVTFAERRCSRLEVFPVRSDSETGTALLRGPDRERFLTRLNCLSQIIAEPGRHRRLWEAYCLMRLPFYLHRIAETRAGLDRPELRKVAAAHLKNLFACEAHHEVIVTALELLRNGVEQSDAATHAELEELVKG